MLATMIDPQTRLLELVREKALLRGSFILASGRESSYFFDGRMVSLDPEGSYLIGKLMFDIIKNIDVTAVGGLTLGADPIATSVALVSYIEGDPKPAFLVRKEPKPHGTRKLIEGPLPKSGRVAIVEDTVTTGQSVLKAIKAVENEGCEVAAVLALIDRLEGGRALLEGAGYNFYPLFTLDDLEI